LAVSHDPETGRRRWVYPLSVQGRFQRIHRYTGLFLQILLFAIPWTKWRGGPLVLIDLPGRKMFLGGAILTPRDTVLVVLIGLSFAFLMFFLTAVYGRLWCGYLCPQTVFREEWVRPIEELFEGSRGKRKRQDTDPWTLRIIARKVDKTLALATLSCFLSMTLVSYFVPARTLWTGEASPSAYALMLAVGGVLLWDFLWFREQLCNYLCPYARFQGALTDEDSLVIAYDEVRGEPQVGLRLARETGSCMDCNKCVAVCPQGVDIREGYQLECINCSRCVDACESVMGPLGHDSLVRYTTLRGGDEPPRLRRGRTLSYGIALLALASIFVGLIFGREEFEATIHRSPGSLYVEDSDGWVRNLYILNVTNNANSAEPSQQFELSLPEFPEAEIIVGDLVLGSGENLHTPLVIRLPPSTLTSRTIPIQVEVRSSTGEMTLDATFKTGHQETR